MKPRSVLPAFVVWLAAAIVLPAVTAQDAAPASAPPDQATRLQGSAYFDRNRDVVGATVVVQPMQNADLLYLTSTDGAGRFKVDDLANGEYRVGVERYGVVPVTKNAVQVRFPFRAVVELDMEPAPDDLVAVRQAPSPATPASDPVRLEGTIRDSDLRPLAEATVRLVHAEGRFDPVMATSGEDGTFALADVPGGTWQLTIQGVGTLPIRTQVTLVSDTAIHATLVRQPASYEPSPFDLMPAEQPIPPTGLGPSTTGS